jgi:1,4-alpha-glucan branching enzyme
MQKKTPTANGTVRVTFELPAAVTAEHIALCGEFNDWSETASPMRLARNGRWHTMLPLQQGRSYRFRYLADGERWINDWAADDYVANPFGGDDSVICL